jgi:hypothetical protein
MTFKDIYNTYMSVAFHHHAKYSDHSYSIRKTPENRLTQKLKHDSPPWPNPPPVSPSWYIAPWKWKRSHRLYPTCSVPSGLECARCAFLIVALWCRLRYSRHCGQFRVFQGAVEVVLTAFEMGVVGGDW